MLKLFKNINYAFPVSFIISLHVFFVLRVHAFGIQPPVEPQDERLMSIYN